MDLIKQGCQKTSTAHTRTVVGQASLLVQDEEAGLGLRPVAVQQVRNTSFLGVAMRRLKLTCLGKAPVRSS